FFKAEDGIRDRTVTGVQTCALPISDAGDSAFEPVAHPCTPLDLRVADSVHDRSPEGAGVGIRKAEDMRTIVRGGYRDRIRRWCEIGRASCRERVEVWELVGGVGGRR